MLSRLARLRPTRAELREMLAIAGPIVLVSLGQQLMGVVDVVMLGRVSAAELAAGGLGNLYFHLTGIAGIGVLLAIDPVVAQAVGAGDDEGVARGVQRGLLLALLVTVLVGLTALPSERLFTLMRQPAEVTPAAARFVWWSLPGLLPFYLFVALRQVLQAKHLMRPVLLSVLVGNVLNVLLNWVFIFGHLGVAAGGSIGSAQATSIARWAMLVCLLWTAWPALGPILTRWRRESLALAPLGRMLAIGIPIGLQFFAEVNAFGLVTIMAGWMGTATLAGHEIALNLASTTFMVPLGVASAASVMVGQAIGAGDTAASQRDAVAALALGVGFMAVMGVVLLLAPGPFARLYTADASVVLVAAGLLPIAGLFQVFDGMQAVASGILRGAGDTTAAMLLHVLSFWGIGVPLSWVLAFPLGYGAAGLWWGLSAGLSTAAVLQLARVRTKLRRPVARVTLDFPIIP